MLELTIKNILIPVNFTEDCENAIAAGIEMSKRHQATLHLLYVKDHNNFSSPPGKSPEVSALLFEGNIKLQVQLEKKALQIQENNNIRCHFHSAEGEVVSTIARMEKSLKCDIIILQKPARRHRISFVPTPDIYKLIKGVSCPVLSIPGTNPFSVFKNILFPVRAFPKGIQKLYSALPIIRHNKAFVTLYGPVRNKKQKEDFKIIDRLIKKAGTIMKTDGIDSDKEMSLSNDRAKDVIKKAVERKSDLIVISATVKKGISALFIKNYTEKIVNNSPVPVLSVKIK